MTMYSEFKNGKIDLITVLNQFTNLVNDVDGMWTKDCTVEQFYNSAVAEYTKFVVVSNPTYC
jgi:hypothetical protein